MTTTRKLSLRKQSLRRLDSAELTGVAGGIITYHAEERGIVAPEYLTNQGWTNDAKTNDAWTNMVADTHVR